MRTGGESPWEAPGGRLERAQHAAPRGSDGDDFPLPGPKRRVVQGGAARARPQRCLAAEFSQEGPEPPRRLLTTSNQLTTIRSLEGTVPDSTSSEYLASWSINQGSFAIRCSLSDEFALFQMCFIGLSDLSAEVAIDPMCRYSNSVSGPRRTKIKAQWKS